MLLSACQVACESMGDAGALLFTGIAFAWGMWQRHLKAKAAAAVLLEQQNTAREREAKEMYKQLSLRPPPLPKGDER